MRPRLGVNPGEEVGGASGRGALAASAASQDLGPRLWTWDAGSPLLDWLFLSAADSNLNQYICPSQTMRGWLTSLPGFRLSLPVTTS